MNAAKISRARWMQWVLVAAMTSTAGAAEPVMTSLGFPLDPSLLASGKIVPPPLGTAQGTLVVDGKTIALKYAYAVKSIYPAMLAPAWSLERRTTVDVVFSDVELPPDIRRSHEALANASFAGKFRGTFFSIHGELATDYGLTFFYPVSPQSAAVGFSAGNLEQEGKGAQLLLRGLKINSDSMSGTLEMTSPYKISTSYVMEPGMPDAFQLTKTAFNAKLEILSPPVELNGAAAAATAQFDVFARFNEQCKRGAFDGMAALASDEVMAQMRRMLEAMGADEMKNNTFSREILKKAIVGAVTVGDKSTLVFRVAALRPEMAELAGNATQKIKMSQVNGSWKISEM